MLLGAAPFRPNRPWTLLVRGSATSCSWTLWPAGAKVVELLMTSLVVLAPPISRTSWGLTSPPDEEMTTILAKLSWSVPNQMPACSDLLVPAAG